MWNGSQRLVGLTFSVDSGGLKMEAPYDRNLVPPGFYLLFVLNDRGVPSVGHTVRVDQPPVRGVGPRAGDRDLVVVVPDFVDP